jgi:hypothetical protein
MASRLMDNLIAAKLLYMLTTPFDKTDAFKLGIIDAKGKVLKPASTLHTDAEKNAYNYLTRLIFNVKRLINKLPGGESNLKNLTAAYFMVKEKWETKTTHINEQQFTSLVARMDKVTLVEEELAVLEMLDETKRMSAAVKLQRAFEREQQKSEASRKRAQELLNPPKKEPIKEDGEGGGVAANATGPAVSTDTPKIGKKDIEKYKKKNAGVVTMGRRPAPLMTTVN